MLTKKCSETSVIKFQIHPSESSAYPLSCELLALNLCFAFLLFPAHRTCPLLKPSCIDANVIMNDVTTKLTAEPEQQASFLAGYSLLTICPESGGILCSSYCWSCHWKGIKLSGCFPVVGIQTQLWGLLSTASLDVFLWSLSLNTRESVLM